MGGGWINEVVWIQGRSELKDWKSTEKKSKKTPKYHLYKLSDYCIRWRERGNSKQNEEGYICDSEANQKKRKRNGVKRFMIKSLERGKVKEGKKTHGNLRNGPISAARSAHTRRPAATSWAYS